MSTGTIFEIREFCLHDGPGIRTTVFLKGCPLRCAWCHNPEGISPDPELLIKPAACIHCGTCQKVCRHPDHCVVCGDCARSCPKQCRLICGIRMSTDELRKELLKNQDILQSSKGGITFSGGEPLLQHDFVTEAARTLHPIHLAIETSGYATLAAYQQVISEMDLVFQDLKHPNPEQHKIYTGVDPRCIHQNLRWLKASGKPFIARIPLIPGVNDATGTLRCFADLLKGPSGLLRVELLPYHLTAGAKYPFAGMTYQPPFDEHRKPNADTAPFLEQGIPCKVM